MATMLGGAGRAKYTETTKGRRYRCVVTDPEIPGKMECEVDTTKYAPPRPPLYLRLESNKMVYRNKSAIEEMIHPE